MQELRIEITPSTSPSKILGVEEEILQNQGIEINPYITVKQGYTHQRLSNLTPWSFELIINVVDFFKQHSHDIADNIATSPVNICAAIVARWLYEKFLKNDKDTDLTSESNSNIRINIGNLTINNNASNLDPDQVVEELKNAIEEEINKFYNGE